MQKRIPLILRMPLALITTGAIAFGPIYMSFYLLGHVVLIVLFAIFWLSLFQKFILGRIDCFWNLRTIQNKTCKPEAPDNLKRFKTAKAYFYWIFLGKNIEENQKL